MDGRRLLSVDGDDIGASFGEISDTELGLHNHQMAIKGLVRDGAEGIDYQRANSNIGNEAAIHDINVDPVAASLVDSSHLHRPLGIILEMEQGCGARRAEGEFLQTNEVRHVICTCSPSFEKLADRMEGETCERGTRGL